MPIPRFAPCLRFAMALAVGLAATTRLLADSTPVDYTPEIKAAQRLCETIDPLWLKAVIAAQDPDFADRPRAASIITISAAKLLIRQAHPELSPSKVQGHSIATTLSLSVAGSHDDMICILLQHARFGHGTLGHDTAARRYFRKGADELSLAEIATLAGFLGNPVQFSRSSERAQERRNAVLHEMAKLGMIDESVLQDALVEPLTLPR